MDLLIQSMEQSLENDGICIPSLSKSIQSLGPCEGMYTLCSEVNLGT